MFYQNLADFGLFFWQNTIVNLMSIFHMDEKYLVPSVSLLLVRSLAHMNASFKYLHRPTYVAPYCARHNMAP